MKVVAIVQARMGSTRFPNKVMKPICGVPMIELLLKRLAKSQELDHIVVATSIDSSNKALIEHVESLGFACEQGSEDDVLERYVQAAEKHKSDVVVRITGDCPLVDPNLVDDCIREFHSQNVDYLSNTNPPTYPDGLDVAVVKTNALQIASRNSHEKYQREHVMPYIRNSKDFQLGCLKNSEDLSSLRWTVDEPEDFDVITNIFNHFKPNDFL